LAAESLVDRICAPCEKGSPPLESDRIQQLLLEVPGWAVKDGWLVRDFSFKNYYRTVAFVNAVVFIAHAEDHHPDIEFGYKTCSVRYLTHSVNGLSDNDFICAAKINALI